MAGRWDEEDWSLALADQGCAEHNMEDVNAGAPGKNVSVGSKMVGFCHAMRVLVA
jgi:hypothetical protein